MRCLGWLILGHALMLALAPPLLRLSGVAAAGNQLSFSRALFVAINAGGLCGFDSRMAVENLLPFGQAICFGLVLVGTFFTLVGGGIAVARLCGWPARVRDIVQDVLLLQAVSVLLGALALWTLDRGAWASFFQSAAALAGGGVHVGRPPAADDWRAHAVIVPLHVIGALGIPLLLLMRSRFRGRGSSISASFSGLALVYAVGTIVLLGARGVVSPAAWPSASILALSGIGAPLGVAMSLADAGRITVWMAAVLMIVGGPAGGTAGGLTFPVFRTLGAATWRREEDHGIALVLAGRWLGCYVAIVLACFFALLATQVHLPADRLLLLSISAASNVGLTAETVTFGGAGNVALAGAIVGGRLIPLILCWSALRSRPFQSP